MRVSSESCLRFIGSVAPLLCLFGFSVLASSVDSVFPESQQVRVVALDLQEVLDSSGRFEFQLGTLSPDAPVSLRIDVHNSGDEPMRFRDSSQSCNCTSVVFPTDPLEVGARGVVELEFDLHNRQGEFETTVAFGVSVGDATDLDVISGHISAHLRRDVWLSPDDPSLLYSPADLLITDHIRSRPIRVHVEDSLRDVSDGGVFFAPFDELPTGVSVHLSDGEGGDPLRFHLRVDSRNVPDLPSNFTIPLIVCGLDSRGEETFTAVRELHVRAGPRHEWVVEPSDSFLGVFSADDLPIDRTFELSLDPMTSFRVMEPSGTSEGVVWHAQPDSALSSMALTWSVDPRLSDNSVGIHSVEIPIPIICREGTRVHEQEIVLQVQYIVL
jgi:Protein of unknown function (DUF1573)